MFSVLDSQVLHERWCVFEPGHGSFAVFRFFYISFLNPMVRGSWAKAVC